MKTNEVNPQMERLTRENRKLLKLANTYKTQITNLEMKIADLEMHVEDLTAKIEENEQWQKEVNTNPENGGIIDV